MRALRFVAIAGSGGVVGLILTTALALWSFASPFEISHLFSIGGVRFGLQHLLWPAYLVSRLGFIHTWIVLVGLLVIVGIAAARSRERSAVLFACIPAAYCLLGWVYCWVVPVPLPLAPFGMFGSERPDSSAYADGFSIGFRQGLLDAWMNTNFTDPSVRKGLGDGLLAGVGERERVAPGVIPSATRGMLQLLEAASDPSGASETSTLRREVSQQESIDLPETRDAD